MQKIKLESIDLEITTKCNLFCSYCYVGIASLKNQNFTGDMSKETMEQVFDLIEKYGYPRPTKENGKDIKATVITIYGGEPLLSFDLVKYFVNRSNERNMQLSFSLLSNGTIGTPEMVQWFKTNKIWVQRSIDGCPEAQEKYRPNSIKPYEEATKLWRDFESSRRMTIQPEFAKLLMKSFSYFESQGFKKGMSPMPNFYVEWTEQQIQDFENSLWEIGRYYDKCWDEGRPFYNYYLSREMVARFMTPQNTSWGCGGGRGLHCVTWDGWLCLCHRFSKEPFMEVLEKSENLDTETLQKEVEKTYLNSPICFGTLKQVLDGTAKGYGEDIILRRDLHERGAREDWNKECKTCIAQYSCEKECMHINYKVTNKLNRPPELYCRIRQTSARIVTWLDSKKRCKDPDWWIRGNTIPSVQDYVKRKQTPEYLTARLGEAVMKVEWLKQRLMNINRTNQRPRNDSNRCSEITGKMNVEKM